MESKNKLVEFNQYCYKCVYKDLLDIQEPCNECISNPVNENSHKPVKFQEAKDANND